MSAIFHHENFLLYDAEIVTGLQFDDFYGCKLLHRYSVTRARITITAITVAIIGRSRRPSSLQDSTGFVDITVSA